MSDQYENKSVYDIKHDVKQEFKKIENSKRWFYRDDQEIYEAWKNIISSYISQLSKAKWMRVRNQEWEVKNWEPMLIESENKYKNEALNYFTQAKAELDKKYNDVLKEKKWYWGMYVTSHAENEDQIQQVAKLINDAEEKALIKIQEYCIS